MIFFAVENDIALATCMAMPMEGTAWEICKLGSNKILERPLPNGKKLVQMDLERKIHI